MNSKTRTYASFAWNVFTRMVCSTSAEVTQMCHDQMTCPRSSFSTMTAFPSLMVSRGDGKRDGAPPRLGVVADVRHQPRFVLPQDFRRSQRVGIALVDVGPGDGVIDVVDELLEHVGVGAGGTVGAGLSAPLRMALP